MARPSLVGGVGCPLHDLGRRLPALLAHVRVLLARYRAYDPCPSCAGSRLKPEALAVRLNGRTLPELSALEKAVIGDGDGDVGASPMWHPQVESSLKMMIFRRIQSI